jgi:hypothetical protein
VLLAYTLPSQDASIQMSLAMLPGHSVLQIGIRGQMLALGHFCVHLLASCIQSDAYCDVPDLNRWEPEPNNIVVPGGIRVLSRISIARSASSLSAWVFHPTDSNAIFRTPGQERSEVLVRENQYQWFCRGQDMVRLLASHA